MLAIDPQTPSTLYASGNGDTLYRTADGGATWTSASVGIPGGASIAFIAVDPGSTLDDPDLRTCLPRVYPNNGDIQERVVRHGGSVTFELAAYDRSGPLIIDTVLSFATIFGGGGSDQGRSIAVDSTGATYVAGNAGGGNFPVVNGKSGSASSLAKISAAGDALVYSTYLASPGAYFGMQHDDAPFRAVRRQVDRKRPTMTRRRPRD